ncbi:MAG: hypothetical protein JNL11_05125 [Bdellovibrionaceae bacterium]|nr:hypothetical protein [Pseudobdellovibrionaceae bacterium]
MKSLSLILSLILPTMSMATSLPSPDAEDLYCEQAIKSNSSAPHVQLQISSQYKEGAREFFVAIKYTSEIDPNDNFTGAQTFLAQPTPNTIYWNTLAAKLPSGESYSSTLISSRFNDELKGVSDFDLSEIANSSNFVEIRLNTNGLLTKAVVLRFIQIGSEIDIDVVGLRATNLSLKDFLIQDRESMERGEFHNLKTQTNMFIYDENIKCEKNRRFSHHKPRPNLIK